jgi:hypothetical protein
MVFPFVIIGIGRHLLLVKFTCIDLSSLRLMNHCAVQLLILSAARCSWSVASLTWSPTAIMAVSSAYFAPYML